MENFDALSSTLDSLFSQIDVDNITADTNTRFANLPDGYYLCEVSKAELRETKTNKPMYSFQFKVFEDGHKHVVSDGNPEFESIPNTKNRVIFKNYVISKKEDLEGFISDMLKFEVDGEQMLEKSYFTSTSGTLDALDVIIGSTIYMMLQTYTNRKGEEQQNTNIVKWSVANELGLPTE